MPSFFKKLIYCVKDNKKKLHHIILRKVTMGLMREQAKEEAVAWQDGARHASSLKGNSPTLWLTKIRLTLRPPWLNHLITFAYERPNQSTHHNTEQHWWSPHFIVHTSNTATAVSNILIWCIWIMWLLLWVVCYFSSTMVIILIDVWTCWNQT